MLNQSLSSLDGCGHPRGCSTRAGSCCRSRSWRGQCRLHMFHESVVISQGMTFFTAVMHSVLDGMRTIVMMFDMSMLDTVLCFLLFTCHVSLHDPLCACEVPHH